MEVLIKDGLIERFPYSVHDLRRDNPQASIPDTREAKQAFGVFPVVADPMPEITATQVAEPGEVMHDSGVYRHGWVVRDKTEAELLAEIPWKSATEARKAVVEWIDGLTSQIEALYPSAVQKRWEIEEAAARAVKADIKNGTSLATERQLNLVTDEGAAKGRTPEDHADAIIANADKFRAIADETNKLFLATDKRLQDAQSPLEYPAIFEWAKQQAAPLAAEYGLEV